MTLSADAAMCYIIFPIQKTSRHANWNFIIIIVIVIIILNKNIQLHTNQSH